MSLMLKDLPKEDLPRERLLLYGSESLSNEELISIILRTGTKGKAVSELSKEIIHDAGSINELKNLTINRLKNVKGLGNVKGVTLLAALELGKRVYETDKIEPKLTIHNAFDAYRFFGKYIYNSKQENFMAIYLDTKKNYIAHRILFKGSLNSSIVHPREVFKEALLHSASAIIVLHNHPSGITKPSKEDDEVTMNLLEVGSIMGIPLLDHLIVGESEYFSYLEEGKIRYE